MWKNLWGILVNIVHKEFQNQKPEGPPFLWEVPNLPKENIHKDTPKAFPHITTIL